MSSVYRRTPYNVAAHSAKFPQAGQTLQINQTCKFLPQGLHMVNGMCLHQLCDGPVFVIAVWQVTAYNQRDLLLVELFDGNLERIGLAFEVDQDGSIHTDLQCTCTQYSCTFVFGDIGSGASLLVWDFLRVVASWLLAGLLIGIAGHDGATFCVMLLKVCLGIDIGIRWDLFLVYVIGLQESILRLICAKAASVSVNITRLLLGGVLSYAASSPPP